MSMRDLGDRLFKSMQIVFLGSYSILSWPPRKMKASLVFMVDYMLSKTVSTVQKMLFLWSVLVMLVIVSLMLYSAFYSAFVPTAEISRPVHLEFRVCSSGVGICSFPSGNVSFWNEEGTVQEFLSSGQAYTVELVMVVPDSHANRDLGMFMVVIKMYDRYGQVSATTQRSTMFRYKSVFLRAVDLVLLSPLYLLGFMEQKMVVPVEMFAHFIDDYYHPTVGATVEIHSHKIEIYSITLRLKAKLRGLKYFLHNWPVVSAFCAFWVNLLMLATGVAAVLVIRRVDEQRMIDKQVEDEEAEKLHETSKLAELKGPQTISSKDDHDIDDDDDYYEDDEEEHDLETHGQLLVQDPFDFPVPEENEELLTELRQRRIQ